MIISVMGFALDEVMFKRAETAREVAAGEGEDGAKASKLEESVLFIGFSGIINLLIGWPILLILDATGVETYEPMGNFGGQIMLNGFIDTVFNAAFIWGVSLTSPLFMSTGTIMIIPVGIVVDILLGKGSLTFVALCGVFLIVAGFLTLSFASSRQPNRSGFEQVATSALENEAAVDNMKA